MKKNSIRTSLPFMAAALLAGALLLFAGCEKEKTINNTIIDDKSSPIKTDLQGTHLVCETEKYNINLLFSADRNTIYSSVKNKSKSGLLFMDSTWYDYVWNNDSIMQLVSQRTIKDSFPITNKLFAIKFISSDTVWMQYCGFSNFPTWMIFDYKFIIKNSAK